MHNMPLLYIATAAPAVRIQLCLAKPRRGGGGSGHSLRGQSCRMFIPGPGGAGQGRQLSSTVIRTVKVLADVNLFTTYQDPTYIVSNVLRRQQLSA